MKLKLISLLPLSVLLVACSINQATGCVLPPTGFSKSDLIGTWIAGWSNSGRPEDTLIFREDGMYKQIIHLEYTTKPPFDYESDWQTWQIEYSKDGQPYLHLKGMHLCAYGGGERVSCEQVGGGDDETTGYWFDFCQKAWVRMPGEGVLIVQGRPRVSTEKSESKDVSLFLLRKGDDVWAYDKLKKTSVPSTPTTSSPN